MLQWSWLIERRTAIALACKIGAAGSRRLGGTMVMVFYVFCCVLCVVVCARGRWFLGVRRWLISTRCGARLSASKSNAVNLILRLCLYYFLHMMSSWHHESIHNNTSNQQTPPPWWWSCSPLQRCGFDDTTPPEERAALRMFIPRPLSKDFFWFIKLI